MYFCIPPITSSLSVSFILMNRKTWQILQLVDILYNTRASHFNITQLNFKYNIIIKEKCCFELEIWKTNNNKNLCSYLIYIFITITFLRVAMLSVRASGCFGQFTTWTFDLLGLHIVTNWKETTWCKEISFYKKRSKFQ